MIKLLFIFEKKILTTVFGFRIDRKCLNFDGKLLKIRDKFRYKRRVRKILRNKFRFRKKSGKL